MKKVVFVDRDGTIILEPADKQIDSLEKLEFIPGIIAGLRTLVDAGFSLIMVSNQDGLGTRQYPREKFRLVQNKLIRLLEGEGIQFEKVFICPHRRSESCSCRKPKTGLVSSYLKNHHIEVSRSFVLGDRATDVEFAHNLGLRAVHLTSKKESRAEYSTPKAAEACRYIARSLRSAALRRKTRETDIRACVSLDGTGVHVVSTGIGFFDHMLAQFARHSGVDLQLHVAGDLHIDEHHSVEDSGIVLGEVLRRALGEKRGIQRFGFIAPLDEAVARVVLDLSGRAFLDFRCTFTREMVGKFPTELTREFFRGLAEGLKATVHISCRGKNDHHKIESIFKSFAQSFRQAIRFDERRRNILPTTKGLL
ncbi:MAG TPA: bifunctional histidinol-phosphatase/imidazoleglycerol-phosphate dehydratase HisB [Bacteroidota bacterium]|nr:bifunctional histidinol-phosphatase/imidazoleglycerol-phosphate dehydratase HisB [Bacteroidota bacterium]